jgi:RNA polymerase sigma factor (sigma-70 family)
MTDSQNLLAEYVRSGSETAFRELVACYVNLVYSTALRLVESDAHRAEDVAQTVFLDLAGMARTLPSEVMLGGWLHRHTCFVAAKTMRGERRRQSRERQAVEMNALQNDSEPDFTRIAPLLDEAINELGEDDRTAILLRFFEERDFQSVGQVLGSNEDAARMRVNRALDKLGGFLKRRGITTTAASLGVVLSANAVQAAPVSLAVTISAAAALAGTTLATTTTVTVTKAIAMTALQKTLITATIAVLAGAGIYESRQASRLRDEMQTVHQQEALLAGQMQALQREHSDATNRLALMNEENTQLKSGQKLAELLRLRGEVGTLRKSLSSVSTTNPPATGMAKLVELMNDPATKEFLQQSFQTLIQERYRLLFAELKLTPGDTERFTQLIGDLWWKGFEANAGSTGDRAQILQARADATREIESQLQAMLGEAGYARYHEFNQELPARTTVKLLNEKLGAYRLTEDQHTRLLQIVKSEPPDLTQGNIEDMDEVFFGSQDIEEHFRRVAESNQRILDQAASFLTAQQLAALAELQSYNINMQKKQGVALTQQR